MEKEKVTFGQAAEALKAHKRVTREGWNGKDLFIFLQLPAGIDMSRIPLMASLPQTVKDTFEKRFLADTRPKSLEGIDPIYFNSVKYKNNIGIVLPNNTISSFSPTTQDILSNDWLILDNYEEKKEIGDAAIMETTKLSIGAALQALRNGHKVYRAGWNGKEAYLYYVKEASYPSLTSTAKKEFGETTPYEAYIAKKTSQGTVITWSPSGSDILADDWCIELV